MPDPEMPESSPNQFDAPAAKQVVEGLIVAQPTRYEGQELHAGDSVPVQLTPEQQAAKLAEYETNQQMMEAATKTEGVPGQRSVVESQDTTDSPTENLITAPDVPLPHPETVAAPAPAEPLAPAPKAQSDTQWRPDIKTASEVDAANATMPTPEAPAAQPTASVATPEAPKKGFWRGLFGGK